MDKEDKNKLKNLMARIKGEPLDLTPTNDSPDLVLSGPRGYSPTFTSEEQEYLKNFFKSQETGPLSTISLICKKHSCPVKEFCPIYEIDPEKVPLGKRCPVESTIIDNMMRKFKEELKISDDDAVDTALLKEYVMWQIYGKRAQEFLAKEPEIIRKEFAGYTEDGEPLYREFLNPVFQLLEKSSKTKQKILDALIATREAKSRDTSRKQQTFSEFAKIFQERLQKLKELKKDEYKVLDTESEREDID